MTIQLEIKSTETVVLRNIDRAIEEALKGMLPQRPGETALHVKDEEIKFLEKWAKKMYLHFPKETATMIIDFVDDVHTGAYRRVKHMVDKTVYHAIATKLHVTTTIAELRETCPDDVEIQIKRKASEILQTLYKQDDIQSIAALHMEVALFRANDLTQLYMEKRRKDLLKTPNLRNAGTAKVASAMDQYHENAMNYFYRQSLNTLKSELTSARHEAHEKYREGYKKLFESKAFTKEMKQWLHEEIYPELRQACLPTKHFRGGGGGHRLACV